MANKREPTEASPGQALDTEQARRRLDMLDQRLDSIDSVVTALVERVMKQPMTISLTCPNCGKNVEIVIVGTQRPSG